MRKVALGKVAQYIRGITFKPDDVIALNALNAVVCMRTKNVQTLLDDSDLIAVDSSFVKRDEQYLAKGDLLVSSANSWNLVGKTCYVPQLNYKATAGGFISIIRPNYELVNDRYLYYWLSSDKTQHYARLCGRQTTNISNLDRERFLNLRLPLPSLEEQKRIAAILDKADAIRRKRKEAIALTEELLRSTFLDMFGDPVTNQKGWDIVPIELLASKSKNSLAIGPFGSNLKVDDYREEGHPVIFVRDVQENGFEQISKVFVDDRKFEELKSHHLNPNDVIATKMGLPPCKATVYPGSMPIGVITADIIKVTLDQEKALPKYVSAAINSEYCKRQVAKFTEGITRPKVTLRDFKKLLIPCPPITLQKDWETFCNQQKQTIERLRVSFDVTSSLFNSLLQKAFRGEL